MLRRSASHRIIFEGQSRNTAPPDEGSILGHGYPWHLMRGRGLPYSIPAVPGVPFYEVGWTGGDPLRGDLYSDIETRVLPLIGRDEKTIVILCGGFTDVTSGNTGSEIYSNIAQHAETILSAGANYVMATTIVNSTVFDTSEDDERENANDLILTNADNLFREVVNFSLTALEDVESTADPEDPYENPWYSDGTHWYDPGAILAAETVAPHLETVLAL